MSNQNLMFPIVSVRQLSELFVFGFVGNFVILYRFPRLRQFVAYQTFGFSVFDFLIYFFSYWTSLEQQERAYALTQNKFDSEIAQVGVGISLLWPLCLPSHLCSKRPNFSLFHCWMSLARTCLLIAAEAPECVALCSRAVKPNEHNVIIKIRIAIFHSLPCLCRIVISHHFKHPLSFRFWKKQRRFHSLQCFE